MGSLLMQLNFLINCLAGKVSNEVRKQPIATKSGIVRACIHKTKPLANATIV
jgi:hypothetical protein